MRRQKVALEMGKWVAINNPSPRRRFVSCEAYGATFGPWVWWWLHVQLVAPLHHIIFLSRAFNLIFMEPNNWKGFLSSIVRGDPFLRRLGFFYLFTFRLSLTIFMIEGRACFQSRGESKRTVKTLHLEIRSSPFHLLKKPRPLDFPRNSAKAQRTT